MTEPGPLLELRAVSKSYPSPAGPGYLEVVKEVSLSLDCGESVAVFGPSGSGKSTLLNLIGTLVPPTSGTILLQGRELGGLDEREVARIRNRVIGFVFQQHHLLPQCTVIENVLLPTLADVEEPRPRDQAKKRAEHLLERVGLQDRRLHRPAQLSGGECQRVAVARALINEPKLLLADEPTGSLDQTSAQNLGELIAGLNRDEKVALVVVTHSTELARLGTRLFRMCDGRLVPDQQ